MFKAITSETKVKRLNARLFKRLREYNYMKVRKRIIFPQGHWDADVLYSEELGLWWYSDFAGRKYPERYWNVFGLENPLEKTNLNIACEINMPLKGVNFRTAGLWANDESGEVFLLHSGKIGGGTKGVGKGLFLENYTGGELEEVYVNGVVKRYATVSELEADNLGEQLHWFVKEISRIKSIARQLNKPSIPGRSYRPEFHGSKKYNLPEEVSADCNHGIVVEALKVALEGCGLRTYNNRQIDLFSSMGKRIQNIFEVKTAISRQIVYTATGQLLINSVTVTPRPKMFFVCPATIKENLVADLRQLGISVIKYAWQSNEPRFTNLNDFFSNVR